MKELNIMEATVLTSPNPLTLICSKKEDGSTNLAPICFVSYLSFNPPTVSIGGITLPFDEKELADLWQLLVGSMTGGSDALTPDGNLTLIDDIGTSTKAGKQFIKAKYTKQAEDIRESVRVLKEKLTEVLENRSERNRWISQFTQFSTLETLDRRALIHMVQSIRVRGKKELDITFTHEDEYKKALRLLALAAQQKDYEQRKVG